MSAMSIVAAQEQFTATLSAVEDAARFAFRRLRPHDYEEKLAEAMAAAWSAWHGLVKKGKDPVEVGVHGIATNAIRNVRQGRRVGNKSGGGRGAMDVYHPKAQARCGFRLVSLDSGDEADAEDSTRGSWRERLAEDRRVGPADLACARVDFAAWMESLPARDRRIVELLAQGNEGVVVARLVGISPGRVSQLRPILEAAWREFQGQTSAAPRGASPAGEDEEKRRGRTRYTDRDPFEVTTRPTTWR